MLKPQDKLSSYFCELASRQKFSSVVRMTQGEEERFAGAYGYASRAWKITNALSTRFDTASITKLFTAVAALQRDCRRVQCPNCGGFLCTGNHPGRNHWECPGHGCAFGGYRVRLYPGSLRP